MKATKASQLTAIFDSAVPADVSVEVKKGDVKIDGTHAVDGSTVTFDATANFPTGTYTFTATQGDVTKTAEVEVKAEYVAEIVLKGSEALTSSVETASSGAIYYAYIYYDVLNQYGDSMRTTTSVTWTTSAEYVGYDKSLGRITVSNGSTPFTYGSLIYVTGVHTSSGTILNTSIPVGMEQAVDSIEFAGFLSKNDKITLLKSLPNDFAKDTYYLLYKTFDQNGNPLDVTDSKYTYDNLTFMADNPLLLSLDDSDQSQVFTVAGEEYASIGVEPGQYVDKGGEVNITAISNKTGKQKKENFVVGSNGVLQSLVLSTPAVTVADGDTWVEIPYVATDANGNSITNYETIVRSTNTLTLSASSDTTLKLQERDDGTAVIYWSDNNEYDPTDADTYNAKNSDVTNGVSRNISLTTVVVGGESHNLMLEVSDMRIPTAIKSVKLNDDNNDIIAAGNSASLVVNPWGSNFTFLDQYGAELSNSKANAFFENAAQHPFGKSSESGYYGIKVDVTGESHLDLSDHVYYSTGEWDFLSIPIVAKGDITNPENDTVKFSIAKTTSNAADLDLASVAGNFSAWNDASKVKSTVYSVVPVGNLKNYTISGLDNRLEIETKLSGAKNGNSVASGSAIGGEDDPALGTLDVMNLNGSEYNQFKVQGSYNGKTVTLPATAYEVSENSKFEVEAVLDNGNPVAEKKQVSAVTGSALLWSDLYDFNTYASPRKDAKIDIALTVTANGSPVTKTLTVSDELATVTTIKFHRDYSDSIETATLNPWLTALDTTWIPQDMEWNHASGKLLISAYDQYGRVVPDQVIEYTVSDITENTDSLAHVPNNFVVNGNGSSTMSIEGAEIKDTFKLTAKIQGTNITDSITITVGADGAAYIDQAGNGEKASVSNGVPVSGNKDIGLRELLGYDR